ncbi:MAG: NAD(P)/FAD-dependent oxidoreductase, partial [Haloferacaceae archaeon]
MREHDLVVVGSGSGLDVASAAASQGWDVGLIEEGALGGTCLNRGCIPSKYLVHRADVAETIQHAGQFGIQAEITDVDFAGIVREVSAHVDEESAAIRRGIESSDRHTLYDGEGRFVDERTFRVEGYDERVRGEHVLVAAGSRPQEPSIEGLDGVEYLTSKEALRLTERPQDFVMIGGGYVSVELAHFFATFGVDVTIVQRPAHLLPDDDREVADALTAAYRDRPNVEVLTNTEATAVRETDGTVVVEADGPDGPVERRGDELLVATGRVPNTDRLDAAAGGVETDAAGFVVTDDHLRTTAENTWALGDVVGEYLYKHSANYEAGVVARNLVYDRDVTADYAAMPHAVFGSPQVAGVGETEEDLRAADREYVFRTYAYDNTAMGGAMQVDVGFVKVLVDPAGGEILGCHVVGPHASSLIHEVVVAMRSAGGTVEAIRDAVHVHPALNEVISRAFSGQFHRPEGH